MKDKKKILIFIDLPIILRHFVANKTFDILEKNYNLLYVFNEDKFDFKENEIVKKFINSEQIRIINMPKKELALGFGFI